MPLITCPDCGKQVSDLSEICIGCGRPIVNTRIKEYPPSEIINENSSDLKKNSISSPPQEILERVESVVIEVSPTQETFAIQLKQDFGWVLKNRQEIVFDGDSKSHLEGRTLKTLVDQHHYVKMHFSRNLNLPHIAELRELEKKYEIATSEADAFCLQDRVGCFFRLLPFAFIYAGIYYHIAFHIGFLLSFLYTHNQDCSKDSEEKIAKSKMENKVYEIRKQAQELLNIV
jgi:hypothetical protein